MRGEAQYDWSCSQIRLDQEKHFEWGAKLQSPILGELTWTLPAIEETGHGWPLPPGHFCVSFAILSGYFQMPNTQVRCIPSGHDTDQRSILCVFVPFVKGKPVRSHFATAPTSQGLFV